MITIEEAKKELREYQQNIKYIKEKQNDALELRTRLESTTKRLSGMPSGKGGNLDRDMLAESIDKMDKIIAECDKKLQELLLKKFVVENKIEMLDQPFKSILFIRYIRNNDFAEVARKIGYGERHIHRLHGEALQKYAEI